ncbi:PucR family transcriptional regulator [Asanoa iriomotensis]|uniref:PucR-like helix-turn-helix protein n=1 Tax=Asanoa iriomotensis TaxID=234613 RepID=A0ABQ4C2V5_9ACTN|nr:helix-turn-helix domain-containing protein [Asanoa iriomotensis]GIF56771.1 hypothetical protein Air01nite_28660 [Asanoa iriomotensis]
MTDESSAWLAAASAEAVAAADPALAAALGMDAARRSVALDDLVDALLAAAAAAWPGTVVDATAAGEHRRAARMLEALRATVAVAVEGYHRDTRAELRRQAQDRAAFVDDLLTGHADHGRLAARAHRYGIRLAGQHTVAMARAERLTGATVQAVDAALAARFGAGNTLTSMRDGRLVCVATGSLRGVPAELAHHLLAHLGPDGWQIGVGRAHQGLAGLSASLDEARDTLDFADRLGLTATILHAADLLVFPVLLRDRDAMVDLVTTALGPLTSARGGAAPLLDTLMAFFDNQGNHTATARQLHISVRAVTYRLDRVQALTGYHPSDPTQRFTLHTAVLGARLLGWPDQPGNPRDRPNAPG